jgi:hypothetical protein
MGHLVNPHIWFGGGGRVRISDFGFLSGFGFRVSGLGARFHRKLRRTCFINSFNAYDRIASALHPRAATFDQRLHFLERGH